MGVMVMEALEDQVNRGDKDPGKLMIDHRCYYSMAILIMTLRLSTRYETKAQILFFIDQLNLYCDHQTKGWPRF